MPSKNAIKRQTWRYDEKMHYDVTGVSWRARLSHLRLRCFCTDQGDLKCPFEECDLGAV